MTDEPRPVIHVSSPRLLCNEDLDDPIHPYITAKLRPPRAIHPRVVVVLIAHAEEPFILLGRDVLNQHRLVLDGPGLAFEIG